MRISQIVGKVNKTIKKTVDKGDNDPYNVDKADKKGVKALTKFLEREREEAQEFAELVLKVPKERKGEIESLVNGFCLGVEACRTKNHDKTDPVAV